MNNTNENYAKTTQWLTPMGYVEIYKNHSSSKIREFHFIKDKIRAVCIFDNQPYVYLHADIVSDEYPMSLKLGKFHIGDTAKLNAMLTYLKRKLELLK